MSVPAWLAGLVETAPPAVTRLRPAAPPGPTRSAAVLILLAGTGPADGDVLLQERATTLRSHSGQVAFPGGSIDLHDAGPVEAALRESVEETGLDPAGVDPLVVLPELFLPPSRFVVAPVLAHWRAPSPVRVVDRAECAQVLRVPLTDLVDPAHRFRVRHPSGYTGPAFGVAGLLVWGFTGMLLDTLLDAAGWSGAWDTGDVRELDTALAGAGGAVAG